MEDFLLVLVFLWFNRFLLELSELKISLLRVRFSWCWSAWQFASVWLSDSTLVRFPLPTEISDFEVLTAVKVKINVSWEMSLHGSRNKQCGITIHKHAWQTDYRSDIKTKIYQYTDRVCYNSLGIIPQSHIQHTHTRGRAADTVLTLALYRCE